MAPPSKPDLPRAAEPRHRRNFDPWNSVGLGHQRAEAKGPQGWRESRTWKLHGQLAAGSTGGARLSDAVGAGSEDFDEERRVLVPKGARARAADSVMDMLRRPGTMGRRTTPETKGEGEGAQIRDGHDDDEAAKAGAQDGGRGSSSTSSTSSKIFDGLVIYVNGSTHPLVSDHKLKHLLVENGARMSVHLGRRQVTHVILGRPSGPNSGAGGGLAGGKLDKEIRRVGGCGVKYVGVEW